LILALPNDGPYAAPSPPFSWAAVPRILERPAVRLATIGYLGHMWEIYAVWTWIGAFIAASESARVPGEPSGAAPLVTFAVVGIGAPGCWFFGNLADQWGRVRITSVAMFVSGLCALTVGLLFAQPLVVLVPVLLIWGVAVVADSAQFSTAISELSPPE